MCLAIPGKVIRLEGSVATLDLRGQTVTADASLVSVRPGDFVLVYSGLIVQTLEEEDALERLRLLGSMGAITS